MEDDTNEIFVNCCLNKKKERVWMLALSNCKKGTSNWREIRLPSQSFVVEITKTELTGYVYLSGGHQYTLRLLLPVRF